MKATELIDELSRRVNEFGDGEVCLPDPLESWWYPVDSVHVDLAQQRYQLAPAD